MIAADRTNQQALVSIREHRDEEQREPYGVLAKVPDSFIIAIGAAIRHSRAPVFQHGSSPTEDDEGTPPTFAKFAIGNSIS